MKKVMNSNNLESIANFAFSMQTIGKHAKPDVKAAREAYNAYLMAPTPETLLAFKGTVAQCVENQRSGFDKLAHKLEESDVTQTNQTRMKK